MDKEVRRLHLRRFIFPMAAMILCILFGFRPVQAAPALESPGFHEHLNGTVITLTIDPVEGADGYQILMEQPDGKFRWIASIAHTGKTVSRTVQGSAGKSYRFCAKAYTNAESGRIYSKNSEIVAVTIPGRPGRAEVATSLNYHQMTLRWASVKDASGYEVYQSTGGRYQRLRTLVRGTRTSLIVNGKEATTYRYRIRAYRTVGSRKIYGPYSVTAEIQIPRDKDVYTPDQPLLAGMVRGSTMNLNWKQVGNADGYEVLQYDHDHQMFRWYRTIRTKGDISINITGTPGETGQFKVKAFREIGGKRFYSKDSNIVVLTVPLAGGARKVLMVGDSRTVMTENYSVDYGWAGRSNFTWIAKSSMGYNWLETTAAPRILEALDGQTDLYLWLGVNDLYQVNRYVTFYREHIPEWNAKGARVYLLSVGPVTSDPWATNEGIEEFNGALQSIPGAIYLNVYEGLTAQGYTTIDGIHYDAKTSKWVYDLVLSVSTGS